METKKLMIVGVGGQGTLLASKIIGKILLNKGYDVKVSEVHGMSQRGGSVVTYVSWGEKVYSPIVDKGEADYILAFEILEAARWTEYLKKGGKLIANTQETNPMPVITGVMEYPKALATKIKSMGIDIEAFDALAEALKAGSSKLVNLILVGKLSNYFDFTVDEWLEVIKTGVPEKFLDMNINAFNIGREL